MALLTCAVLEPREYSACEKKKGKREEANVSKVKLLREKNSFCFLTWAASVARA
jgi:hypothetical protein